MAILRFKTEEDADVGAVGPNFSSPDGVTIDMSESGWQTRP